MVEGEAAGCTAAKTALGRTRFLVSLRPVADNTYQIGVDGGGTKTELILVDTAGAIVARHIAPGCNPNQAGADRARETLLAGLDALFAAQPTARGAVASTQLYMAGAPDFWREFAAGLTGYGRVSAATDALPILELSTGGAPGLALHAGTGSFVTARAPDGSVHYAGGLGWKLGDPGSGFELGRRGVAHALLELQGWAAPTPLGAALKTHTGLTDARAITRLFYSEADANARLAAFAPHVVTAAAQGCVPAQTALALTIGELVEQARLVTTKLFFTGAPVPCGVCGGILNSPPSVYALRALVEAHGWPVELRFITEAPIEGVRRLLLAAR